MADYSLFSHFSEELLKKLEQENLAYHAHNWVVRTEKYKESKLLQDFFEILAVDNYEGDEFVMAVEGKKYPVTALMFHPETQNRHIVGDRVDGSILGKVNSETTDEIHYRVS